MAEEDNALFYECPSVMKKDDKFLISASVCTNGKPLIHHFSVMFGTFRDLKFAIEASGEIDKGPDQYAGQIFKDEQGRCILFSSCLREILIKDGKIKAFPVRIKKGELLNGKNY